MDFIRHKGRKYTLNLDYVPPENLCSQCHHFDQGERTVTDYEGYEVVVKEGCHIEQYTKCHTGGPKSLWEAREEL